MNKTHYSTYGGTFRVWGARNRWYLEMTPGWGFAASVELPTTWHEYRHINFRLQLIWGSIYLGLPWFGKLYPDHYQCKGPTYGFYWFEDAIWWSWGQKTGRSGDRNGVVHMPWSWWHSKHHKELLTEPETHDFTYVLKSGEVQRRKATIQVERRTWTRNTWLPRKMIRTAIDVQFDGEVGERSGSWKGGTIGCSYDMKPGETPIQCLRRMEREREFR